MTTPKTFAIEIIRLLSNIQPVSKLEFCRFFKASGNTKILVNPDFVENSGFSGYSRSSEIQNSQKSGFHSGDPFFRYSRSSRKSGLCREIPDFQDLSKLQNSRKSGFCKGISVFQNLPNRNSDFQDLSKLSEIRILQRISISKIFQNPRKSDKSGLSREIPVSENLPKFQILYRNSRKTRKTEFC